MNENIDLKKLEKKAASTLYQDGIFDISLGHVLIAFGTASMLEKHITETPSTIIAISIYLAVFIPIWLVYFFVTKPRLGTVKFGIERRKRTAIVISLVTVVLVANIVVFILIFTGIIQFSGHEYLLAVVFGLIPLVLFTAMAYFLSYNRLYLTGAIFSVGFFLKELLSLQSLALIGNIVFISMGGIIVTIGIVFFIRFLKKYPKIKVNDHEYQEIGNQ